MLMTLEEALRDRERQYTEFKESRASVNEAAKTLVGFANSRGGQVFFGVTDEGGVRGIDIQGQAVENLARDPEAHIYPSLPLDIEPFTGDSGKTAIRVGPRLTSRR